MNLIPATSDTLKLSKISSRHAYLLRAFFAGILLPLGFAPFHFPGLSILGLALLFAQLRATPLMQPFLVGFVFGLGFLGFGVSWIYVSIHEYGHLNLALSASITLLFVFYLAIYPGLVTLFFSKLAKNLGPVNSSLLFCSLWCLGEYLRATVLGGFPWLLIGFGQIDTPLSQLLPLIGIYGVSFLTCLAATCLTNSIQISQTKRYFFIIAFVSLLLLPALLAHKKWTLIHDKPISVGVIQANLSMRDKWDESLFWQLLARYQAGIDKLINKNRLIVMPESAIPVPPSYISDFLEGIHAKAIKYGSSVLLGIPKPTNEEQSFYYNALIGLGKAKGHYLKQHLVPFGEYTPRFFAKIMQWLAIPEEKLKPGETNQSLIKISKHAIATLICYELAYPQLLRKQLPQAEWVVSISDDGWFGRSLAMYQHLQMAQALSLQTGRYQIVANNDGLSSIINDQGDLVNSLPAFTAGTLESTIYAAEGATPWTTLGDAPSLIICLLMVLGTIFINRFSR